MIRQSYKALAGLLSSQPLPGVMRSEFTCPKCGGNQTVKISVGLQDRTIPKDIWGMAAGPRPRVRWENLGAAIIQLILIVYIRDLIPEGIRWARAPLEGAGDVAAIVLAMTWHHSRWTFTESLKAWKATKRWEDRAWICLRDHESWEPDQPHVEFNEDSGEFTAPNVAPIKGQDGCV